MTLSAIRQTFAKRPARKGKTASSFPSVSIEIRRLREKVDASSGDLHRRLCPELLTDVSDTLLSNCLGSSCWLSRQLKHRCLLTLTQPCQENNAPIRKFECIMVLHRFVLINLSEDCRRVT